MQTSIDRVIQTNTRLAFALLPGIVFLVCALHSAVLHAAQESGQGVSNRGIIKIPFDIYTDTPRATVDSHNRIVVSSSIFSDNNYDAVLFRFLPNGAPDQHFASNGMARIKAGGGDASITKYLIHSLAIGDDGKIVLAGATFGEGNKGDFLVMRFLENGMPDLSLNRVGWNSVSLGGRLDFGWGIDEARDVLVAQDGAIVLAGGTSQHFAVISSRYDFGVVRYRQDGTLDRAFAANGKGVFRLGTVSEDYAYALAQDDKQRLIVAGKEHTRYQADMAMIRLDPAGRLDPTFGSGGKVTVQFGEAGSDAKSIAIDSHKRVVVGGGLYRGATGGYIQRYSEDGILDRSFGMDGTVRISSFDEFAMLKLQDDNKIVIVGTRYATHRTFPAIVTIRLVPNGTPDKEFGRNGESVVEFDSYVTASSIALSSDSDIYVCGSASRRHDNQRANNGLLLFKLNHHGMLIDSFGH